MEISLSYHNLNSYDKEFNLKGHYVTDMFSRILDNYNFNSGKVKKVSIALIKERSENLILYNEGVVLVKSNFDLFDTSYQKVFYSAFERLILIHRALLLIADKFNFDKGIIDSVFDECSKLGIRNEYYFGDKKLSKDELIYGLLWIEHGEADFCLFIDFFESKTDLMFKRTKLVSTLPYWTDYRDYLVPIKTNKRGFYLSPKGGKPLIEIPI
jgi:hypothetical protein